MGMAILTLAAVFFLVAAASGCRENETFPSNTDCSLFFRCDALGKRNLYLCPSGLHFSNATGKCEDPSVANCTTAFNLDNESEDVDDDAVEEDESFNDPSFAIEFDKTNTTRSNETVDEKEVKEESLWTKAYNYIVGNKEDSTVNLPIKADTNDTIDKLNVTFPITHIKENKSDTALQNENYKVQYTNKYSPGTNDSDTELDMKLKNDLKSKESKVNNQKVERKYNISKTKVPINDSDNNKSKNYLKKEVYRDNQINKTETNLLPVDNKNKSIETYKKIENKVLGNVQSPIKLNSKEKRDTKELNYSWKDLTIKKLPIKPADEDKSMIDPQLGGVKDDSMNKPLAVTTYQVTVKGEAFIVNVFKLFNRNENKSNPKVPNREIKEAKPDTSKTKLVMSGKKMPSKKNVLYKGKQVNKYDKLKMTLAADDTEGTDSKMKFSNGNSEENTPEVMLPFENVVEKESTIQEGNMEELDEFNVDISTEGSTDILSKLIVEKEDKESKKEIHNTEGTDIQEITTTMETSEKYNIEMSDSTRESNDTVVGILLRKIVKRETHKKKELSDSNVELMRKANDTIWMGLTRVSNTDHEFEQSDGYAKLPIQTQDEDTKQSDGFVIPDSKSGSGSNIKGTAIKI